MLIVLAGGMLAAAVFDLRARRIPDVLNLALGLAGLAVNAGRHGLPGLAWAGLGLSAALLFTLAPFARRALGGGDVKLLAALGLWLGPLALVWALAWAGVAGGLLAVFVRRRARATVPYAVAIAAGAAVALVAPLA